MSLLVNGEILLYGDVGTTFWGDGFTPRDVAKSIAAAPDGKLVVRVNSGGGNAFDGVAIHALLKAQSARGVEVRIDGIAASAASLIAMAGTEIVMADGAMLMIHDPSQVTWGNAEDHRKSADTLDAIADSYASVYADRSGKSIADARAIMKAETWYSADEAIEAGFATSKGEAATTMAAFDYTVYRAAPAALPRRVRPASPAAAAALPRRVRPASPAAAAALPKEKTMTVVPNKPADQTPPANPSNPAPQAAWHLDILASADKAGLSIGEARGIIEKADTREAALSAIVDMIAARSASAEPERKPAPQVDVIADGGDKFRAGAAQALLAKGGVGEIDRRNEFNGITLMQLATDIARRSGPLATRDPQKIIVAAIGHSSSDFPLILENVAEKSMLKGYEEQEETFNKWCSIGSLSDFKPAKRVDLNAFGALPAVAEGAEYTFGTFGERGETLQLATYGRMVSITRQAIINDDVAAFTMIPRKMGRAALRTVGNEAYKVLTANANMSDGVALFHTATHKNNATGGGSVLSQDALDAARTAMALQKDRTDTGVALNIMPAYLLVPVTLAGTARQIISSTYAIKGSASDPNTPSKVQGMAEVIADARLDAASLTTWYLAASKNYDTVEVSYLNGQSTPTIERQDTWMVDGVNFKIRLDFATKALAWETLYRAVGA
jgi:ATP-dependent protease ClpP protease subunit